MCSVSKLLLVLPTLFILSCDVQSENEEIVRVIAEQRQILVDYLEDPSSDTEVKRVGAISFFEELTGIDSNDNPTHFGKINPTREDIERWDKWVTDNFSRLRISNGKVSAPAQ